MTTGENALGTICPSIHPFVMLSIVRGPQTDGWMVHHQSHRVSSAWSDTRRTLGTRHSVGLVVYQKHCPCFSMLPLKPPTK